MIYDVLLTFDRELSTIWRRRCSLMTIIYIVNRYSLIVNIVPMLIWGFDGYLSTMCMVTNSISAVTTTLPIIAVAGFGAVRVHAMWEQSLWLSIPTFVLMLTPAWTNIQATVATYLEAIDPLPPPYGGCILATSNTQLELRVLQSISRATPIAGDALILAVTWCKTYRNMREAQRLGVQTKLTNLLLQDGTFYFGIMFALNFAQLMLDTAGSNTTLLFSLTPVIIPMSSLLVSRFILDLRDISEAQNGGTVFQSDLEFARGSNPNTSIAQGSHPDEPQHGWRLDEQPGSSSNTGEGSTSRGDYP